MRLIEIVKSTRQVPLAVASFVAGGALMVGATALASGGASSGEIVSPATTTTTQAIERVATPDCTRAPFRGANYEGCDLRGTTFDRVDLTYANFRGANLDGAYFHELTLSHVDFTGASMIGTAFSGVTFNSSRFEGSSIGRANIEGGGGGDGLSTGLPAWQTPQQVVVSTDDGQLDLSPYITGVAPLVVQHPEIPLCDLPLVGDGFTTDPVHLTNCPSQPVQWHWEFIWGRDFQVDFLKVMNLSHEDHTAHLPLIVKDGFGRRRTIDVVVTVSDFTVYDEGDAPGEYWVYGL